jgi:DNA-binding CsgD family transcriptional regulator
VQFLGQVRVGVFEVLGPDGQRRNELSDLEPNGLPAAKGVPGLELLHRQRRRVPWDQPGPADPQPCVLLVSRVADQEATDLQALLHAVGIPCVRLDAEAVSTAELVIDLAGQAMRLHDHWIKPTVTWLRHFPARAPDHDRAAVKETFLRDSWQSLVSQLTAVSTATIRSEEPGLLAQLALAAALGIKIPRTVIATDPAQATAFLPAGRRVVKAVHRHFAEPAPGLPAGAFPELVDSRALAGTGEPAAPPVVVQQYVDHDLELRAYYVSGKILAFEVGKSAPADAWFRPERLAVRQTQTPQLVETAIRRLASALSLDYGAFSFLLTDGVPTFLEVNLAGDWCWIEQRLHARPVTTAVAWMLRDLYFTARAETDPAPHAIELTAFLASPGQEPAGSSANPPVATAFGASLPPEIARALSQTPSLSPRERTVFELLGRGYDNRTLARILQISERTAKRHVTAIFAKLGLESRLQAGLVALLTRQGPESRIDPPAASRDTVFGLAGVQGPPGAAAPGPHPESESRSFDPLAALRQAGNRVDLLSAAQQAVFAHLTPEEVAVLNSIKKRLSGLPDPEVEGHGNVTILWSGVSGAGPA